MFVIASAVVEVGAIAAEVAEVSGSVVEVAASVDRGVFEAFLVSWDLHGAAGSK